MAVEYIKLLYSDTELSRIIKYSMCAQIIYFFEPCINKSFICGDYFPIDIILKNKDYKIYMEYLSKINCVASGDLQSQYEYFQNYLILLIQ